MTCDDLPEDDRLPTGTEGRSRHEAAPPSAQAPLRFLSLGPVLGTTLLATLDAHGIQGAANHVVAHARQVLHATSADEHDGVLLEVVTHAGDVGRDFDAVRQTHARHLPQRGIWFLRSGGEDADADAPLLGARAERGTLGAPSHPLAAPLHQLADCRHLNLNSQRRSLKHTEPAATCPRRPGGAPGTLRPGAWLAVEPPDSSKGPPGCQELVLQKLTPGSGNAPRGLGDPLVLPGGDNLLHRSLLQALFQDRRLHALRDDLLHRRRAVGCDLQPAVDLHAGAGRDQSAHDHVLLQPAQVIDPPRDGRLRQHARRLLERGRRDERVGRQRGLGDPEQQRPAGRGLPGLAEDPLILGLEAELVHLLVHDELGVAHLLHLHPAHHLADDRLDVLVVDVDALQPVDLLDLVHQVLLQILLPLHAQDVVRVARSVDERIPRAHPLPFLDVDVHALGDLVFAGFAGLRVLDDELPLALDDLAVAHDSVDLGNDRRLLRAARLEQLDDARQTAGDVFGLRGLAGNLRQDGPG